MHYNCDFLIMLIILPSNFQNNSPRQKSLNAKKETNMTEGYTV